MGLSDLYFGPRTIIVGSDEDPHSALPESALDNVLSPATSLRIRVSVGS